MHRSTDFPFVVPCLGPLIASTPGSTPPIALTVNCNTAASGVTRNNTILANSRPAMPSLPATKPKRPLSAYNLFFQFERTQIVENASPAAPKINFKEMARMIAKRWKNVDSVYKMELTAMANKDKLRYKMAMRSYRMQLAEEAEELQRQEESQEEARQHGCRGMAVQAASVNAAQLRKNVKEPPVVNVMRSNQLSPMTLTFDMTTPTNILRDSSVASLAEQLDDEMMHAIICIFS